MAFAVPALPTMSIHGTADIRALFTALANETVERCGFAYLDPEWRLIGLRETPPGAMDGADVPLRAVISDVIAVDAAAVVMVHNHPAGDPTPSAMDRAITRRLAAALETVDSRLLDHVVLAGARFASMRQMGLL